MSALLQFEHVQNDRLQDLTFSLNAGEIRVLEVLSLEDKLALVELATGETAPDQGNILLNGQPLQQSEAGSVGWVPVKGGLISNLKVWENITLPLWYHRERQKAEVEQLLQNALSALQVEEADWERFMASPVARLTALERKVAGILRGLIAAPQLLLLDAELFNEIDTTRKQAWIKALENYAGGGQARAVLLLDHSSIALPWEIIQ